MNDVISRQAVLDLAQKGVLVSNRNYESVCKAINKLPSVNPQEQKVGHWIKGMSWKCDQCHYEDDRALGTPFCPKCGARMVKAKGE